MLGVYINEVMTNEEQSTICKLCLCFASTGRTAQHSIAIRSVCSNLDNPRIWDPNNNVLHRQLVIV